MLKYKCLVLDHDDTVVRSSTDMGYPSFCETLAQLRPHIKLTLDEFLLVCFEPGFPAYCQDVLGFTEAEMALEGDLWRSYITRNMPPFFSGMADLIRRYKEAGGILCVASQSHSETILRDYREQCGLEPDSVFGWELGPAQRKPNPYPLQEIMRRYQLLPHELLMVDDLKPGLDMAKGCGVPFACAGWGHGLARIASFMKDNCALYLEDIGSLETLLFAA